MRSLITATLSMMPFGTIYAFSVLLRPLESILGLTRSDMSLVFGIATLVFTIGMNISPWLYARISTGTSLVLAALLGAAGLFLSSQAQGFGMLMLGFGVLFGLGGGISMTTAQQIVNLSPVKNRGLMNGYIVSLLPLGAMIGGPLLSWSIEQDGVRHALLNMSVVILVTSVLAAWITGFKTIVKKQQADQGEQSINQGGATGIEPESRFGIANWPLFINIALVFFLAAAAGLMVLSQSVGILLSYGAANQLAVGATSLITGMIAAARLSGGWMVDRFTVSQVMLGAHAWSLTGAMLLSIWPNPITAVIGLMMVGMGYGFISGSSAGGVAMYWHKQQFGLVSSRIYIGWCVAALSLPVLAGLLFDWYSSYQYSIWIAAIANVLGMFLARRNAQLVPAHKMSV